MASVSVQSNLSVGQVNQRPNVSVPLASQLYPMNTANPTDVINLSLKKTTTIEGLSYPGELPKYYLRLQLSEYHRFDGNGGNLFQVSRLEPYATITLPLPQQLINNDQVVYDQAQLGILGGNMLNEIAERANKVGKSAPGMNNIGSAMSTVQQFMSGTTNNGGPAAVIAADLAAKAAESKSGFGVKGLHSLATDAARLAGYTPNQFLTILLKGPAYKRHHFTWTIAPHNEQEARNIQKIINVIENAKTPGLFASGALFTFPSVFTCSIMPNSQFMYKFKPAVLEGFTVDYSGGGMPAFRRAGTKTFGLGTPAVLQIQMQFLEIEYWLRGNYSDNNDPLDTTRQISVEDDTFAKFGG